MPRGWPRSVLFDWCKRELTPLSTDYRDFILDQLSQVEDIKPRRMFGGLGLFKDSVIFGMLSSMDGFYLRVDNINQPDFEALSAEPFRPNQVSEMTMAYIQVPVEILDDPERLAIWAAKACDAVGRNAAEKTIRSGTSRGRF